MTPFQCRLSQYQTTAPVPCTYRDGHSPLVSVVPVDQGRMNPQRWGCAGQWGWLKGSGTRGARGQVLRGFGPWGNPSAVQGLPSRDFAWVWPPDTLEAWTWPEITAGHLPGGKTQSPPEEQLWGRKNPAFPKLTKKSPHFHDYQSVPIWFRLHSVISMLVISSNASLHAPLPFSLANPQPDGSQPPSLSFFLSLTVFPA